jgi:hypothetical protein
MELIKRRITKKGSYQYSIRDMPTTGIMEGYFNNIKKTPTRD